MLKDQFQFQVPHQCSLTLETVDEHIETDNIVIPHSVKKENGTTYIPLDENTGPDYIIEVYQFFKAPTFARLEQMSKQPRKEKEARYQVRVSVQPHKLKGCTPQSLLAASQKLIQFLDLLVYG